MQANKALNPYLLKSYFLLPLRSLHESFQGARLPQPWVSRHS
jgi:hypothetical protein